MPRPLRAYVQAHLWSVEHGDGRELAGMAGAWGGVGAGRLVPRSLRNRHPVDHLGRDQVQAHGSQACRGRGLCRPYGSSAWTRRADYRRQGHV